MSRPTGAALADASAPGPHAVRCATPGGCWLPPRIVRVAVGAAALVTAVVWLAQTAEPSALRRTAAAVFAAPGPLLLAVCCYAAAFGIRAAAWCRVLPMLSPGQSWAALHVSLLGNHVLPLRLGEGLRITSVLRRTSLPAGSVLASAVVLRAGDLLAVALLAIAVAPALVLDVSGPWMWPGVVVLVAVVAAGAAWLAHLRRERDDVRLPGPAVAAAAVGAWFLESVVLWQVAASAGVPLSPSQAVAVTALTIVAQAVAVTPGGFGTYEAAAAAAMTALGVSAGSAFALALTTHAVKTAYSLLVGGAALMLPAPGYWGRFRLRRTLPPRPALLPVSPTSPVVAVIPVHNEEQAVGDVVRRLPSAVSGRPLVVVVVDDGSTDRSAEVSAAAGANVVAQPRHLGLGAAVRRGLAEASARSPAAVVYLDADGEYFPEDIEGVAAPVLDGSADYVVGTRLGGDIQRMLPHRRLGNLLLTSWVRWLTRRVDITDGQSGFRAFSPAAAAAAEVIHDYNYAQVLTLDLLGKGFGYAEVPIRYRFRESGTSFVRLGPYLRRVVPAVHRELNAP